MALAGVVPSVAPSFALPHALVVRPSLPQQVGLLRALQHASRVPSSPQHTLDVTLSLSLPPSVSVVCAKLVD